MAEQKTIGQIAYEAWFGSLSLKDGKTPMDWPGDMHKDDWEAAASAVYNKAVEECADMIEKLRDNTQQLKLYMGEMEAQEQRTLKAGMGLFAFLLRSLKHSDKTENDNGGCQANAGAKSETVSTPAEPFQADLVAEAWRPISTAPHDREVLVGTAGDQFGTEVAKYDFTFKIGEGWYAAAGWMDPQPTHWMPLPPHPRYPIEEPANAGDEVITASAEISLTPETNQDQDLWVT